MGKIALVTGSNSQLGTVIVKHLLKDGYKVYAGVRDLREISSREKLIPLKLDITKDDQCIKAIKKIKKEAGRIDVLVNNAGYTLTGPDLEFSAEDFVNILNTNAVGAFRLIKLVAPLMKKQRKGRIINITSLNGLVSLPNFGVYSSSKHALEALGEALRYELIKDKIYITNIAPGAIGSGRPSDTKKFKHKPVREKFKFLYFLLPMVTAESVAKKIVEIVEADSPPAKVILGMDALITTTLYKLLPSFVWETLMGYLWNKK